MNIKDIIKKLPKTKVLPYDVLIKYDGILYDVRSINKQKKTATLITNSGEFKINFDEIQEIIGYDEYLKS